MPTVERAESRMGEDVLGGEALLSMGRVEVVVNAGSSLYRRQRAGKVVEDTG